MYDGTAVEVDFVEIGIHIWLIKLDQSIKVFFFFEVPDLCLVVVAAHPNHGLDVPNAQFVA